MRLVLACLRGLRNLLLVVVLLVVMGGLALLLAYFWAKYRSGPDVEVPLVIGLRLDEAYERLINAGLRIENPIETRPNEDFPEGIIIHQDPLPGARTKKYRLVRLVKSSGSAFVVVPDVRTRDMQTALLRLRERGLSVGRTAYVSHPDVPPDRIIAQSPPGRTRVRQVSSVDLLLSLGPEGEPVTMPDFTGASLTEATRHLQRSGLVLGAVTQVRDDTARSGTVLSTDPPARAPVYPGATIDFSVAAGEAEGAPVPVQPSGEGWTLHTYERDLPETAGGGELVVRVMDANGLRTVHQDTVESGHRLLLQLPVRGSAQVFVHLNGILVAHDPLVPAPNSVDP